MTTNMVCIASIQWLVIRAARLDSTGIGSRSSAGRNMIGTRNGKDSLDLVIKGQPQHEHVSATAGHPDRAASFVAYLP